MSRRMQASYAIVLPRSVTRQKGHRADCTLMSTGQNKYARTIVLTRSFYLFIACTKTTGILESIDDAAFWQRKWNVRLWSFLNQHLWCNLRTKRIINSHAIYTVIYCVRIPLAKTVASPRTYSKGRQRFLQRYSPSCYLRFGCLAFFAEYKTLYVETTSVRPSDCLSVYLSVSWYQLLNRLFDFHVIQHTSAF